MQASYFHTDDYDSRVYSYEKGMLNSFNSLMYYGRGFRLALHLRYDISRNWMVMAKWGETNYQDRDEISSGSEAIPGHRKADVQLMARVKI
jgi:hypothetical protein